MARLRAKEPLLDSIQRIARSEARKAQAGLSETWPISDEAVHRVRTRLKKARAALRLAQAAIGTSAYRRENRSFRDAARPLSAVRDARILVETLDRLLAQMTPAERRMCARLRRQLDLDRHRARQQALPDRAAVEPLIGILRSARRRIGRWELKHRDWSAAAPGLRRVYRGGRQSFDDAREHRSAAALHEWRKQVKSLRYQLDMLVPVWPEALETLVRRGHDLGDRLGDDHDLFILRQRLLRRRLPLPARARRTLLRLIDERRADLQAQALRLGEALYAERPRALVERLGACERVWRKAAG